MQNMNVRVEDTKLLKQLCEHLLCRCLLQPVLKLHGLCMLTRQITAHETAEAQHRSNGSGMASTDGPIGEH